MYRGLVTEKIVTSKSIQQQKVLQLFEDRGLLRPRDLDAIGVPREILRRLCRQGLLERVGRGLYRQPNRPFSENQTLAEVCKKFPKGVVCLLSALRYHNLTTQNPFEVWLAIDVKAHRPITDLPVRFVRLSGAAMTEGIQIVDVDGTPVKVFSPAKTVTDCFKFRNKIGLDVALEALKDCLADGQCTPDELWHFGKVNRVNKVMQPYLEAMLT